MPSLVRFWVWYLLDSIRSILFPVFLGVYFMSSVIPFEVSFPEVAHIATGNSFSWGSCRCGLFLSSWQRGERRERWGKGLSGQVVGHQRQNNRRPIPLVLSPWLCSLYHFRKGLLFFLTSVVLSLQVEHIACPALTNPTADRCLIHWNTSSLTFLAFFSIYAIFPWSARKSCFT